MFQLAHLENGAHIVTWIVQKIVQMMSVHHIQDYASSVQLKVGAPTVSLTVEIGVHSAIKILVANGV